LVVAANVVQAGNDKQQLEPMLGQLAVLPADLGKPQTMLGDNGYFSAANVTACTAAEIAPLLAPGRTPHHPSLHERFAAAPPAPENPTPLEAMLHCLATPEGKKLFLLRGLDNVRGEWSLVTMAWNVKRIFALDTRKRA
jgi:hypothetical protein